MARNRHRQTKGGAMSGKLVLGIMFIAAVACNTDLTETEDDEEDNCYYDDSGNHVCCGYINNDENACCWNNQYGDRTCDNTPCNNECEMGDTRCSGFTGFGYEGPDNVAGLVDECRIDDRDMRHCLHWRQRERCEEEGWCSEEGSEAHCVYCSELFPNTNLCQFEDVGHCYCENDDFDWPWRQWLHVCRQIPETVCASWREPECSYGTCDNYRCRCDALP